jgi:uncharacterized protein (DUF362 family)/Pyruvate/2-oxoacid:ferredoxin oxidoreductase delta subunit
VRKVATVSLLRCEEYDPRMVKEKLREGLLSIGLDSSVFQGKKVVIKPNLLNASPAEKGVVTHPEFFRAAVQIVKEGGGIPLMVESPAFQPLAKVMKKTGYDRVVAEEGCSVADPKETAVLFYDGAVKYKRFEVSKAIFDADVIVNLPKFKTHSLTYITGAVKNFFGFISGLNKSQWHVRAPTKEEFSSFLLDLYGSLLRGFEKPKRFIHMMDAITGLEGEGPGVSGRPRSIRAILIGEDAVAVDCAAVHLVGLAAKEARTIALGEERGLGQGSLAKIDLRGERLDGFFEGHYVPSSPGGHHPVSRWPMNTKLVKNLLIERPVPSGKKCTLCYQCKTICPGGAIETSQNTKIPFYNYDRCIRCYCCMEICPEAAISLKRGKLQWVLDILGK